MRNKVPACQDGCCFKQPHHKSLRHGRIAKIAPCSLVTRLHARDSASETPLEIDDPLLLDDCMYQRSLTINFLRNTNRRKQFSSRTLLSFKQKSSSTTILWLRTSILSLHLQDPFLPRVSPPPARREELRNKWLLQLLLRLLSIFSLRTKMLSAIYLRP